MTAQNLTEPRGKIPEQIGINLTVLFLLHPYIIPEMVMGVKGNYSGNHSFRNWSSAFGWPDFKAARISRIKRAITATLC